jgi:hypothetical protein
MNVTGVSGVTLTLLAPTREEMIAIAASRPAVLQQQAAALHALNAGTSGQGTPAVDATGVDLYA